MITHFKKHKILYISPGLPFYGAERSLFDLIAYLDRTKFIPVLLVPNGCLYKEEFLKIGVEVYEVDIGIKFKIKNLLCITKININLIKFFKLQPFSLVHINLCTQDLIAALYPFFIFLKIRKIPLIFHHRTHDYYNVFRRFIMLRGNVICVSTAIKQKFLKKRNSDFFVKPNLDRIISINDGRDLSRTFCKDNVEDLKKEFNLNGKKVIGIVGAIAKIKRQDLFLLIVNEVKKQYPKVKFLIVGDTYTDNPQHIEYKQKVIKMCDDLGLREDVIFTGFRNDAFRFYRLMDIFVLTSKKEALGCVIIEAMASGKPVVVSAVDGTVDIVEDGRTGFLICSSQPKDYAEKILLLLKNSELREKMGRDGKNRALNLFDIKKYVFKIEDIYKNLLRNTLR